MHPPADLIDDVEVVEPPLQELTRKGSFFKRTCLMGCGCLVIVIIAVVVGIYLFLGSGPKKLKTVPDYFPKNIPLYDRDAIEEITIIPGKYEARSVELAVFFPKVILAPLLNTIPTTPTSSTSSILKMQVESLKKLWRVAITPREDYTDTIKIEWRNVHADPKFIFSYYKNELLKNNYTVKVENEDPLNPKFSFSHNAVSGTFSAYKDTAKKNGTSYAVLTMTLPFIKNATESVEINTPTPTVSPNLLPQPHDETFTPPL